MTTRREFLKLSALGGFGIFLPFKIDLNQLTPKALAAVTPTLDVPAVPKFVTPLVIPPAMPRTTKVKQPMAKNIDYYEIAVRQFVQQILPAGSPATTVWGYGSVNHPGTFNYPSFTIEAKYNRPVKVKWINDLKDPNKGVHLRHLLAVDQTLHWANPPGGNDMRDKRGIDQSRYIGPVPIVTHVHGAHVAEESDGYAEAWFLPDASDIQTDFPGYAISGTKYDEFKAKSQLAGNVWDPGTSVFDYPNNQRATTLWYHDHTLGMTRLNVYAGPAGFYLLRGGPDDLVLNAKSGKPAVLPGPAPALGDLPGTQYYEIPIAIQDRSFNADGSLFYPDNRAFFEGLDPTELNIPFIPDPACGGDSDISPIWNPEFFGNTMLVNGKTWPFLTVEAKRYRFRFLNGCNSRFLILSTDTGMTFNVIGTEGGFLPAPVALTEMLMSPAERMDVIMDFTGMAGTTVTLTNLGPDEPFGGGLRGVDYFPADPTTTGKVMQFQVVPAVTKDLSTPVNQLVLPAITPLPAESKIRKLSLNEMESGTVKVLVDEFGQYIFGTNGKVNLDWGGIPFAPMEAMLGVMEGPDTALTSTPKMWGDPITETPKVGDTEIWEFWNFTADAHPIHIHQVMFEVLQRQGISVSNLLAGPELWETGFKDTVIAYPDQITRVKARFDIPGLFVWHCHIVEHEDNEMMRPYQVVP